MTSRSRSPRLRPLLLTLPLTLALALATTGCGTEPPPDTMAAGRSSSDGPAPDRAELEARASAAQLVTEHVWVTEAAGYALARQSVGVLGDDGFSSSYTAPDGGTLRLSVERRPHAEADCTEGSAAASGQEPLVTCERDGEQWYRATESGHAYAWEQGELVVTVSGPRDKPDRATLRSAALAAHRADDRELDRVLPPAGEAAGQQPVERGDLPPVGDGAPNNDVGASG
ncbi:hypothetical protein PV689_32225 [Streptomyces sp. ATCC51928]|uniref:Membrane lipoprotein n=1 Tax=Streptomyces caviscabies TaxID=90079 RepID=A0ABW2M7J6_9ACTN|nr:MULTISPECIES: hypothetical protein [unclassified Streptomyces]MDX3506587.1 hypothetical protein [Streptomyces sp. ATCC51928]MDX5519760.1 hypothetical protein [Streptomyces sp. DE06-01C]QXQ99332.1 hypothetical protein KV381_25425 [Streptomyces sp. WY228]